MTYKTSCILFSFSNFLILLCLCFASFAKAQPQCSALSKPSVKYTFGQGTAPYSDKTPNDFGFTTTYGLENGKQNNLTNDGEFSFVNLVADPWNVWHKNIVDHTQDGDGYMMLVNASYDAGEFYRDTVDGLCTGIQYEFSVWAGNADKNQGRIKPNVRFIILDAYTADTLAQFDTGDLPVLPTFRWDKHAVEFDATTDKVVLLLINNNDGGSGNDLVLDDIAFTPCLPVYDIAGDSVLCIGDDLDLSSLLLASSYTSPEYLWQKRKLDLTWEDLMVSENLLKPNRAVIDSGWYRLFVAETGSVISHINCSSFDSIYIDVIEPLLPGIIADSQTICYNTTPTLFTSLEKATSSTETIGYQWEFSTDLTSWSNAGSTSATFQESSLTADHYYRRKATTDCYVEYSDTIAVTVYDSLTNFSIMDDQIVCDGSTPSVITTSSLITGGNNLYQLNWQSSTNSLAWDDLTDETNISYQPPLLVEDTYIRLFTKDFCGDRISNVVKLKHQLTPKPDSSIKTICEDSPLPDLSVLGTSIQWYDKTLGPITPPNFSNTSLGIQSYFVSETLLGCESKLSPIRLTVHTRPKITLTPQAECADDSAQFIPMITGGSPSFNFKWYNVAGNVLSSDSILNVKSVSSTLFSLVVSDQSTCTDSSAVSLTTLDRPELSLVDTSLCAGDIISIIPSITKASGDIIYDWAESSISFADTPTIDFDKSTTGTYSLIISDENACKDTAEITITVYQRPTVSLTDTALCDGEKMTLTPTIINLTSGGVYEWYDASNSLVSSDPTFKYNGSSTASFTLVFEDDNSCKDTTQFTIIVHPKPVLTLSDTTICEDKIITITPTINNATGNITYEWENTTNSTRASSPTIDFSDKTSTNYTLIIKDEKACRDTASVQITVLEKPIITIEGKDVCSGNPSKLEAIVSNYTSGLTYTWSPDTGLSSTNSSLVNATPSSTTTYLLTVTTQANCVETINHTVGVTTTPTASILGDDTLLCEGKSVTYSAYNDPTKNYTTEWFYSENDTLNFHSIQLQNDLKASTEGYYRILVKNEGFCGVWSDIIHVKTEDIRVSLSTNSSFINTGETAILEANISSDVLHLLWSTGEDSRNLIDVTPEESTTYEIEVKGERCTASDQLFIEVFPPIIIPNGFSPNGDGKNDQWFIKGISFYPNAKIQLFNRWGNIVYRYNSGYDEPWHGVDLNGTELPVATYYYVIEVNDKNKQRFDGSVSIIR